MVVFLLAFFFLVVRSVVLAHKSQVTTGMRGLIGETGVAIRDFDGDGKVFVHGEIWNATSEDSLKRDDRITVVGSKGLTLFVRKA